jgi:hypothetical protein
VDYLDSGFAIKLVWWVTQVLPVFHHVLPCPISGQGVNHHMQPSIFNQNHEPKQTPFLYNFSTWVLGWKQHEWQLQSVPTRHIPEARNKAWAKEKNLTVLCYHNLTWHKVICLQCGDQRAPSLEGKRSGCECMEERVGTLFPGHGTKGQAKTS